MSPTPTHRPKRLSADARRLVTLAESLALSGSRLEDVYWENLLSALLNKLLRGRKNKTIETALEYLVPNNINAYEILIELAETHSESSQITIDDQDYDVLLFLAPIAAWTRYQLPASFPINNSQTRTIATQLQNHILAEGAHLALIPELVCFDQMPHSFQEAWEWTQRLGLKALNQKSEPCRIKDAPDAEGMLADARFIAGAIVVPKGAALFRWQVDAPDTPKMRAECFQNWIKSMATTLPPLFTGCTIEYLQPDAYYVNSREADRRIRPLALKAAVTWLQTAAHLSGDDLRAVVVGCGETVLEEYRVGFSTKQSNDVIYGCIWPILSKEEALADSLDNQGTDMPEEIATLLKELGVLDAKRLAGLYGSEFCDDCGAPYFPNPLGEMLHPEFPDEIDLNPVQFH